MADSKTRKRRLRARRRQAGLKGVLVWLTPAAQAALAALRRPGETLDAVVNRALVTAPHRSPAGTSPTPARDPDTQAGAPAPEACPRDRPSGGLYQGALVALLTLLFPAGQPVYPRTRYGWRTFPLAEINRLLAPAGYVLHATKTRAPDRFILCTDAQGGVERYGLFELRRVEKEA